MGRRGPQTWLAKREHTKGGLTWWRHIAGARLGLFWFTINQMRFADRSLVGWHPAVVIAADRYVATVCPMTSKINRGTGMLYSPEPAVWLTRVTWVLTGRRYHVDIPIPNLSRFVGLMGQNYRSRLHARIGGTPGIKGAQAPA